MSQLNFGNDIEQKSDGTASEVRWKCPLLCGKPQYDARALRTHVQNQVCIKAREREIRNALPIVCELCDKSFSRPYSKKQHIIDRSCAAAKLLHEDTTCHLCNLTFFSFENMKRPKLETYDSLEKQDAYELGSSSTKDKLISFTLKKRQAYIDHFRLDCRYVNAMSAAILEKSAELSQIDTMIGEQNTNYDGLDKKSRMALDVVDTLYIGVPSISHLAHCMDAAKGRYDVDVQPWKAFKNYASFFSDGSYKMKEHQLKRYADKMRSERFKKAAVAKLKGKKKMEEETESDIEIAHEYVQLSYYVWMTSTKQDMTDRMQIHYYQLSQKWVPQDAEYEQNEDMDDWGPEPDSDADNDWTTHPVQKSE